MKAARSILVFVALSIAVTAPRLAAWGGQGHRLVALLAAEALTPVARRNVEWLIGPQTLADVSSWADDIRADNAQTGFWHYINIPPDATSYDRDRDCPRQPGVEPDTFGDRWRDCVIDRIAYHQQRVANTALDRADRAIALKFLVHFVGDLHQPYHALGVERGANGVFVSVFGSDNCGSDPSRPAPCNLHSVWDSRLIARRGLDDAAYLNLLRQAIKANRWDARPIGTPTDWAMESHRAGKAALLPQRGHVDDAYYHAQIPVIDERLALAGIRLGGVLNQSLAAPPPTP